MGVGEKQVVPMTYACPPNTLLTGFSAGEQVWCYPGYCVDGALETLQFFCSNPYGAGAAAVERVRKLKSTQFPRIKAKLSCKAITAVTGDTWLSIAAKYSTPSYPIAYYDVIRANPKLGSGDIPVGARIFIPPCINGVLQGMLIPKSTVAKPQAQSQKPATPLDPAQAAAPVWDSSTPASQAAFDESAQLPQPKEAQAKAESVPATAATAAATIPGVATTSAAPEERVGMEPAAPGADTPAAAKALAAFNCTGGSP